MVARDVFKRLREKLLGVSKRLEDEIETELEAKLEKELEEAVAKKPEQSPAKAPVAAPKAPAPDAAGPADPPAATRGEPVPPAQPDETDAAPDAAPAAPLAKDEAAVAQAKGKEPHQPPVQPAPPATSDEEAGQSAPRPAAEGTRRAKGEKRAVHGRKVLTEEEIESRLARELGEAVELQKDVEGAVGTGARFSINEDVLEEILWELEVAMLESDVALPVIEAIKENVKEQLLSMAVAGRPEEIVERVLRTAIKRVLQVAPLDFDAFVEQRLAAGKKPVVVMFVGVNGTGKTTTIARLAHRLKKQGRTPVLAAGDTFRAGAIEQLSQHADRVGVKIIKHGPGSDPAAVAFDAIEHARARDRDVVLLDTAGRMQTNTNLMDEMDKIRRVAKPDLVVFVGDSLAGNDAVEQARKFDEIVDVGAVVLTKVDVDAKGGAALSVAYTINKPLIFVGVGQDYDDLRPFDATWMVDRLFGEESEASA